MRRVLWMLAGLAGLGAVFGFLLAWVGLVPVAASSGHWPITDWFLHFTMRQSVRTSALGIEVPALDDPALVLRGAGHYRTGCAPCHGAPGVSRSLVVRHMTPEPPYLPPRIPSWEPNELFWIVKHGVKFTGMPAWPAQGRDDEVWAMVAFLSRLPELDTEEYRRLSLGEGEPSVMGGARAAARLRALGGSDGASIDGIVESCARCHGADGAGRGVGAFPILAGQTERYLHASLRAYALGERHSGIMQPLVAGLDDTVMRSLARYYAQSPAISEPPKSDIDPEALKNGATIVAEGIPEQGVPACRHCHGPKETPRNPVYPVLAGQHADYLALQLDLFKTDRRGGTPYAHIMRTVAARLTPDQIRDVALYYASLDPEP